MLQECVNLEEKSKTEHPYSDGVRLGDFLWIGGQLPVDPITHQIAGDDIKSQTEQAMKNVVCILKKYDLQVEHLMRVTIYLKDMSQYDVMNEAYASFFADTFPTRSVVGVNELPHHALIEIEAYALDTRALEVLCEEDCCEDDGSGVCSMGICE